MVSRREIQLILWVSVITLGLLVSVHKFISLHAVSEINATSNKKSKFQVPLHVDPLLATLKGQKLLISDKNVKVNEIAKTETPNHSMGSHANDNAAFDEQGNPHEAFIVPKTTVAVESGLGNSPGHLTEAADQQTGTTVHPSIPPSSVIKEDATMPTSARTTISSLSSAKTLFDSDLVCPKEVVEKYHSVEEGTNFEQNLAWCREAKMKHHVVTGRSWGSLSKGARLKWDDVKCNELMELGKLQSCDQRWGWSFLSEWMSGDSIKPVVQGLSNVTCTRNMKSATFCQYGYVMLDFARMYAGSSSSRRFNEGFLNLYGDLGNPDYLVRWPGLRVASAPNPDSLHNSHVSSSSSSSISGNGGGSSHVSRDSNVDSMQRSYQSNNGGDGTSTSGNSSRDSNGNYQASRNDPVMSTLRDISHCDEIENRPVFVLSNDDIFNLGHYFNDVQGIWGMLMLANVDSRQALLLNIDGVRSGGPAGVGSHRIMVPGAPDTHGPFSGYFRSWFDDMKKGIDYGSKKVCFRELYFPPLPGVPWFWNDWGIINDCSMQAASPLYQSFNLFLRYHWMVANGAVSLPDPPTDEVHIVIEVRAINPKKHNNHSSARHISNLKALLTALQALPNVRVTAQDFAKIPFKEQVALSHSASIFVSMHGAGTTHIFHSALGKKNCCALIELFPPLEGLYTAQGYGNIARMLGMHHFRNVAPKGSSRGDGTLVKVDEIVALARKAVKAVTSKPTCLHDVKNTLAPVTIGLSAFN